LCDLYCVHCRTGSLEMRQIAAKWRPNVHCRTGSLESLHLTR